MPLTKNQQNQIMKKLDEFWTKRECQICGADDWGVSECMFEMREYRGSSLKSGILPILPLVTISCSNCGHTHIFNPLILGILDKEKEARMIE